MLITLGAIFLYNSIRKTPMMSRRTSIKAEFRKISSLQEGSEVFFNGFLVGKVDDIYLKKDQSKMIVVDFSVNPGVKIPISAEAVSYVPSPLEPAYLLIRFDTSRTYDQATDDDWLSGGDVIPGTVGSYLLDMRSFVDPIIKQFDTLVLQAFPGKDSLRQIVQDIEASIHRIENSSMAFRVGVNENKIFVLDLMQKIENLSKGVNESKDSINQAIVNLAKTTFDLKEQDLSKKIPKIDPNAFKTPDFAAINIQIIKVKERLMKISNNEDSTIARLLEDKAFKDEIMNQISKLETTLTNIRKNPEQYVSLKKKK